MSLQRLAKVRDHADTSVKSCVARRATGEPLLPLSEQGRRPAPSEAGVIAGVNHSKASRVTVRTSAFPLQAMGLS